KTIADGILAAWLCVMGFHLFLYYFHITGEIYKHTYLLGIQIPMPLLHGPFLYLYTVTASQERNELPKYYLLHFLPAAMAWTALTQYFILPAAQKIDVYKHNGAGYEVYMKVIFIAFTLSGFAYVLLSFLQLKEYRKRIADEFSNTERINLNWLRYLIYGILAVWIIILLRGGDALIYGVVVIFVSLIGYFGIKHMGIFTYRRDIVHEAISSPVSSNLSFTLNDAARNVTASGLVHEPVPTTPSPDPAALTLQSKPVMVGPVFVRTKYEKSGLQKEVAQRIHSQLTQIMKNEKLFREEELSMAQLAQQLDIHPNYLSQVINTYENKSFYDYINTLRIEEFKSLALLPENSRYTLLSLAFKCGFNSKTSFNRNFKKITGQSPSAFLKEMNVQLMEEA
ncbi:MAG: helix-turn-helix domain-containing protein, partial [Flavisolibacter sp.]